MTTEKRRALFVKAPLVAVLGLAAGVVLVARVASAAIQYEDSGAQQNTIGGWNMPQSTAGSGLGSCPADPTKTSLPECAALRLNFTTQADCVPTGTITRSWATSGVCNYPAAASAADCAAVGECTKRSYDEVTCDANAAQGWAWLGLCVNPPATTASACTGVGGTWEPQGQWSTAVTPNVCAITMKGFDRNQVTCQNLGGTWVTAGTCVGAWVFPKSDTYVPPLLIGYNNPSAGDQCLRCHNSINQRNQLRVRDVETFRYTGHHNMSRKVTPGKVWSGPDGSPYLTDSSGNPLNWATGKITIGSTSYDMAWIYDGWLEGNPPLPGVIYKGPASTKYTCSNPQYTCPSTCTGPTCTDGTNPLLDCVGNGGTCYLNAGASYSCGRCHTTGWTSDATINTQKQPETSFAGITFPLAGDASANMVNLAGAVLGDSNQYSSWDLFGIKCTRCHSCAVNNEATGICSDPRYVTQATCQAASATWTASSPQGSCSVSGLFTQAACESGGGFWYPMNGACTRPSSIVGTTPCAAICFGGDSTKCGSWDTVDNICVTTLGTNQSTCEGTYYGTWTKGGTSGTNKCVIDPTRNPNACGQWDTIPAGVVSTADYKNGICPLRNFTTPTTCLASYGTWSGGGLPAPVGRTSHDNNLTTVDGSNGGACLAPSTTPLGQPNADMTLGSSRNKPQCESLGGTWYSQCSDGQSSTAQQCLDTNGTAAGGYCSNPAYATKDTCVGTSDKKTGYHCTTGAKSTQATCEAAGATWEVNGQCSIPFYTASNACTAGGGTWTATNTWTTAGKTAGTWTGSYCDIGVSLCTAPQYPDAATCCTGGGGYWDSTNKLCSGGPFTTWDTTNFSKGACTVPSKTTEAACRTSGLAWSSITYADQFGCQDAGGKWTGFKSLRGQTITALCMQCHKQENRGIPNDPAPADGGPGTFLWVGTDSHGNFDFLSHWHGNHFLNSPHAQYTGPYAKIASLTTATDPSGNYNSKFLDMGEAANTGNGCTGCHNVHKSVNPDTGQTGATKECTECHSNPAVKDEAPQINIGKIQHPAGKGTPFDTTLYENPCAVCHMPKGYHLWRINTDPTYSTMPTYSAAIKNAKTPATCASAGGYWMASNLTCMQQANTSPDGAFSKAVWVDLDAACGQCHGGSSTTTQNNAPYLSKTDLALVANGIHDVAQPPPTPVPVYPVTFSYTSGTPDWRTVKVYASVTCNGTCSFTYDWTWGDASSNYNAGTPTTHQYAGAGSYPVTLAVRTSPSGPIVGSVTRTVVLSAPDSAPTVPAPTCTWDANHWTMSVVDASTDDKYPLQVFVDWGDGSTLSKYVRDASGNYTFNHTYTSPGAYPVTDIAIDSGLHRVAMACATDASPNYFTLSGTVYKTATGVTPAQAAASATVSLMSTTTGVIVRTVYTSASGTFSAGSLKPDTYRIVVNSRGRTYPLTVKTVGPSQTGITINANP